MAENTTDKYNPLISVQEFPDDGKLQIIHGYGNGGFRIAGQSYVGPQFVLPRQTLSWPLENLEGLSAQSIKMMLDKASDSSAAAEQDAMPRMDKTELVILGVGKTANSHFPQLARELKTWQIRLEVMTTAAACRTWNVLLTEGRAAAVGLWPIDEQE